MDLFESAMHSSNPTERRAGYAYDPPKESDLQHVLKVAASLNRPKHLVRVPKVPVPPRHMLPSPEPAPQRGSSPFHVTSSRHTPGKMPRS